MFRGSGSGTAVVTETQSEEVPSGASIPAAGDSGIDPTTAADPAYWQGQQETTAQSNAQGANKPREVRGVLNPLANCSVTDTVPEGVGVGVSLANVPNEVLDKFGLPRGTRHLFFQGQTANIRPPQS